MSRRPPLGGVVVGVNDGSSARGALTWAAHAARARGLPLVVCHAYGTDETGASLELTCAARNRALRTARYGVEVAESAAPGVTATAWAEEGSPAQVLVDACVDPSMIVVGYRAHGVVAAQVLAILAAGPRGPRCPVAVVPPRVGGLRRLSANRSGRAGGPVIAVVTGGDADWDVLRVAAAEAEMRKANLVELRSGRGLRRGPLPTVPKHAELLVVGMPLQVASELLPRPGRDARTGGNELSLAAVLGYGALRRSGPPVLLVPIRSGSRQLTDRERYGSGVAAKALASAEDRLVPTQHRW